MFNLIIFVVNFAVIIIPVSLSGVCLYGLYLQGAAWSRKRGLLTESRKGELFTEMPVIWLEPVDIDDSSSSSSSLIPSSSFSCPVYKTSTRAGELSTTGHSTNFVLYLRML